jgi:hypothetical protein
LATTIDSKLDANSPALIEMSQRIDGMYGEWTVKIQSNGHIAGIGLMADADGDGGVRSAFLVRADRFAVGHPDAGAGPQYPFVVEGGVVYIAKTAIGTAWIQEANIENLSVKNAKIGWNAVSEVTAYSEGRALPDQVDGYGYAMASNDIWLNLYESYGLVITAQIELVSPSTVFYVGEWIVGTALMMDGAVHKRIGETIIPVRSYTQTIIWSATWPVGSRGWTRFNFQARSSFPNSNPFTRPQGPTYAVTYGSFTVLKK